MLGISLSDSSYLHTPLLVDLCNLVNMLVVGVLNLKKKKKQEKAESSSFKGIHQQGTGLGFSPLISSCLSYCRSNLRM